MHSLKKLAIALAVLAILATGILIYLEPQLMMYFIALAAGIFGANAVVMLLLGYVATGVQYG